MAEVLSQSQIDALLSAMAGGDDDAGGPVEEPKKEKEIEYRKYDFYSPKKYTKDRLKLLRSVYDNYARIATSQVNGLFRVASEIEVVGVEEQRYYEYSNALSETDVITLVNVELSDHSNNPPMLFHIAPVLMGTMIDRMLGGTELDTTVDYSYTYTDIELALYEKIIQYLVAITSDVWANYIRLDVQYERIEENPSMFQGITVDEIVVIVMMQIKLGTVEGALNICIPGTLLGNMFEIIDKTKHLANQNDAAILQTSREDLLENIRESNMEVMAQLGVAKVSLDEVFNLHVGDVIDLNKPQNSDVSLFVSGQPWFSGKLGVHNKNMAVKIEKRILESKNEIVAP